MYWVYIIYSIKAGRYYIGQTNNLKERIKRHNENRNRSTKNKGPWKLVVSIKLISRSESMQLELKLKSFKNSEKSIEYLSKLGCNNHKGSSRF